MKRDLLCLLLSLIFLRPDSKLGSVVFPSSFQYLLSHNVCVPKHILEASNAIPYSTGIIQGGQQSSHEAKVGRKQMNL